MKNKTWVIAVSGGPDSMALLHKMMHLGYECIVAHVNYHMRLESNHEADLVRDFCREHNLVFETKDYKDIPGGNFQAKARRFRYAFFKEVVEQYHAEGVIVGHHEDDALETYLIQQERKMKSDVKGLQEHANVMDVLVWRPLLNESKQELIDYCKGNKIPYALDASNVDPKYTRNRIRKEITDKEALLLEMEAAQIRDEKETQLLRQIFDFEKDVLELDYYRSLDASVRPQILRQWIRCKHGVVHHYGAAFFAELDRQLLNGSAYHDFGVIQLYCDHDLIALANPQPFKYIVDVLPDSIEGVCTFAREGETIQGLSLSPSDFPLTIRSYEPGDEIEMRFGTKSVSRFFIDKKVPRYRRKNWLVIENDVNSLIFVVGMGCDVHHYSNNPETYVIE